ncbi:MBL fold metallo-hydrolase [Stenoxybacter acetivorans]|uniref:MBL fold metallo-hydrolase n=1 Tax=Stenoxybacter acetivorans TaxID=422441 RepID=UPI00055C20EB|nr:MBL fold metallo-hydrolase [Stenoxybacter acetivorans]
MALRYEIIPVTPFLQNSTLLWDDETQEAVLTDVGGESERLLAEVNKRGLTLTAVWLTHGHVDHVGGVVALRGQIDVPVLGPHRDDDFWIQQLPAAAAAYRFPPSPVFTPAQWLQDGDALSVGQYVFQVLHIPGHTPGHVVFYCAKMPLLIAGDVLFRESIGRTDFPRSNHDDLIRCIREKLWMLPPNTRVIPGHGAMTTIEHEIARNPFVRA